MEKRLVGFVSCLLVGGCTPAPPVHFFEGTEVLRARQVAITAAGGVGGSAGYGGTARLGVGVGKGQEVRVEGSALWPDRDAAIAGKVSWKIAPNDSSAFIAGTGVSYWKSQGAWTGDLGLLLSPDVFPSRAARFYTGFRFALTVPFDGVYAGTGISGTVNLPVGLNVRLGDHARLFLEGGFESTWSERKIDSPGDPLRLTSGHGGYGGMGLSLSFGG